MNLKTDLLAHNPYSRDLLAPADQVMTNHVKVQHVTFNSRFHVLTRELESFTCESIERESHMRQTPSQAVFRHFVQCVPMHQDVHRITHFIAIRRLRDAKC